MLPISHTRITMSANRDMTHAWNYHARRLIRWHVGFFMLLFDYRFIMLPPYSSPTSISRHKPPISNSATQLLHFWPVLPLDKLLQNVLPARYRVYPIGQTYSIKGLSPVRQSFSSPASQWIPRGRCGGTCRRDGWRAPRSRSP